MCMREFGARAHTHVRVRDKRMTTYDFTTVVDRSAMGSAKWITMKQANPNVPAGFRPFSVADLDISNAPEIIGRAAKTSSIRPCWVTRWPRRNTSSRCRLDDKRSACLERRARVDHAVSGRRPRTFFAAVRAFTEAGEGVIIQTPAYHPFYMAIELAHRTVAGNPMVQADGHYGIDFDNLADLAKDLKNWLLLFCSPHNPTGRVWTRDELERIARIVCDNDLLLISDEIHFDLVMPGYHHTVFATVGDEIAQRSIICTAPSKTFNLAGMATSNIIIPNEELRAKYTAELTAGGFFVPNCLGYEACRLAYTKGELWLQELIGLIARNHDLVKDYFAKYFPDLHVFDLEGTYLQWIDFWPLGKSADELERINTDQAMVFAQRRKSVRRGRSGLRAHEFRYTDGRRRGRTRAASSGLLPWAVGRSGISVAPPWSGFFRPAAPRTLDRSPRRPPTRCASPRPRPNPPCAPYVRSAGSRGFHPSPGSLRSTPPPRSRARPRRPGRHRGCAPDSGSGSSAPARGRPRSRRQ